MNETKLPDRLHDLASQMQLDLERSAPRTLRRARVRRGATALLSSAVVVAVVLGGVAIVRVAAPEGTEGSNREVPATQGPTPNEFVPPSPAPFAGLWPETTPEALAEAQAQVDDGDQPLRLDPEQTAVMLATNLFGWQYEETQPQVMPSRQPQGFEVVLLRNSTFDDAVPPIAVELAQLGRTGPEGIWSVVSVSSSLIDSAIQVDTASDDGRASITFVGTLAQIVPDSVVRFEVLRGPISQEGTIAGEVSIDGRTFTGSAGSHPDQTFELEGTVLWIQVVDARDRALAAAAVALGGAAPPTPQPTDPSSPPSPDFTELPPDVAVTAQRILDAAVDHDVDALAELIDPATFVYNFDDALDPVEIWRADPGLLDPIPVIFSMAPYVENVQADRPFFVWPYLMEAGALDEISEQERTDLQALGFSDEQIAEMQAFGGYLGPRLTIAADGTWLNYVTGGD